MLKVTLISLLFCSVSAMASTETWNFNSNKTANNGQTLNVTSSAGNSAKLSGWSSSASTSTSKVTAANKVKLDSQWGVQLWNTYDTGYYATNDSHAVDNTNGFDFILLEFLEPVSLLSLTNSWSGSNSWASIAAHNTNPFSNGAVNWGQVANSAIQTASYKNTGVNTPYVFADHNSIQGPGVSEVYANFWLIGAYNPAFNGGNYGICDSIKFASITTKLFVPDTDTDTPTPPGPVPVNAPGTLALFAMALVGLVYRRRA